MGTLSDADRNVVVSEYVARDILLGQARAEGGADLCTSLILVLMLFVVLGLNVQVLRLFPDNSSFEEGVVSRYQEIPACSDVIETQHQFRRLGPRETVAAGLIDVDGDGSKDAVYANQLDQSISIYWGNSNYTFDELFEIPVGRINQLPLIGDVNRDGLLDTVTLHEDESKIRTHPQVDSRTLN